MIDQWKTLKEGCEILGVSESTLRRRIKQGEFQSKIENNKRLVLIQELSQMTGQMTQSAMVQYLQSENQRLLQENAELKEELKRKDAQLEERGEDLRRKDEQMADASQRHDTIVMQLTRQLGDAQKALEYHKAPWWRRLRLSKGKEENKV